MEKTALKKPNFARTTAVITQYALSRSTLNRAVRAGHLTRYNLSSRASFFDTNEIDAWIIDASKSE